MTATTESLAAFASLRRFVDRRADEDERCELCSKSIPPGHRHLMEVSTRRFVCACDPCSLLFADHPGGRYRALPRRAIGLDPFRLSDAGWAALGIPINMAFFSKGGADGRVVAHYPGPGGATESAVDPGDWASIEGANQILRGLAPDVEALLAYRIGDSREHYLVPIDVCFRLAGLIRVHWRGLSGGSEVWEVIGRFFGGLRASTGGPPHA